MKTIFLTSSILFGVAGISLAMDELMLDTTYLAKTPLVFDLQFLSVTFQPAPDFIRVLALSAGFFSLFLIWKKLKNLKIGKLWEYVPC